MRRSCCSVVDDDSVLIRSYECSENGIMMSNESRIQFVNSQCCGWVVRMPAKSCYSWKVTSFTKSCAIGIRFTHSYWYAVKYISLHATRLD